MRRDVRIIFAGGGTGGHVFPAIYMAEYLSKKWGADCQFIGTKKGLENRKVSQAGFLVRHIWVSGFKRGLYLSNLLFPIKLIVSSIQSRKNITSGKTTPGYWYRRICGRSCPQTGSQIKYSYCNSGTKQLPRGDHTPGGYSGRLCIPGL